MVSYIVFLRRLYFNLRCISGPSYSIMSDSLSVGPWECVSVCVCVCVCAQFGLLGDLEIYEFKM